MSGKRRRLQKREKKIRSTARATAVAERRRESASERRKGTLIILENKNSRFPLRMTVKCLRVLSVYLSLLRLVIFFFHNSPNSPTVERNSPVRPPARLYQEIHLLLHTCVIYLYTFSTMALPLPVEIEAEHGKGKFF